MKPRTLFVRLLGLAVGIVLLVGCQQSNPLRSDFGQRVFFKVEERPQVDLEQVIGRKQGRYLFVIHQSNDRSRFRKLLEQAVKTEASKRGFIEVAAYNRLTRRRGDVLLEIEINHAGRGAGHGGVEAGARQVHYEALVHFFMSAMQSRRHSRFSRQASDTTVVVGDKTQITVDRNISYLEDARQPRSSDASYINKLVTLVAEEYIDRLMPRIANRGVPVLGGGTATDMGVAALRQGNYQYAEQALSRAIDAAADSGERGIAYADRAVARMMHASYGLEHDESDRRIADLLTGAAADLDEAMRRLPTEKRLLTISTVLNEWKATRDWINRRKASMRTLN